jgi:hypothetical protein
MPAGMPQRATALILACAFAALTSETQAIGFGRLGAAAVLGQPLNLPMPLRLDAGERLDPDCIGAEVSAGETRFSRSQVRVRVEPRPGINEWVAIITTVAPIEEPVVEITLSVGCGRRFSRRYVVFADPPSTASPMPAPAVAAPPTPPVDADAPALAAAPRAHSVARRPMGSASAPAGMPAPRPRTPPSTLHRREEPAAARPGGKMHVAAAAGGRLLLDVAGPQLKMDLDEPIFVAQPAAAEAGASDAEATVSEADRLRVLEKTLANLQRESQSTREATGALKARLVEAESRSQAVPWLIGLLALALAVMAWLALRVRRQLETAPDAAPWWTPAATPVPVEETGPVPVPPPSNIGDLDGAPLSAPPKPMPVAPPAWRAQVPSNTLPAPTGMSYERTATFPASVSVSLADRVVLGEPSSTEAREVSVEELLDLEQQADFFIALGQEDAAIDLLMSHLRGTGGLSPLPYTKLLEIYRRQNDREAYERIRARFNRRFNAYAPDWDAGPLSGRALEDYPEVAGHLQALWPSPLDAMAMLEAMLFRKDAAYEFFDLPAYKDVLLLYSLARDLWQQGGSRLSVVDVLLPLSDEGHDGAVALDPDQVATSTDAPGHDVTRFSHEPAGSAAGQVAINADPPDQDKPR